MARSKKRSVAKKRGPVFSPGPLLKPEIEWLRARALRALEIHGAEMRTQLRAKGIKLHGEE